MIPMVDLKKQFSDIKEEIFESLAGVFESTQFILGPKVKEFETMVAKYHNVNDSIGVASGTDALHLSLKALGIGKGDEVITTPFTFFATTEAILYLEAKPVYVDIDINTFNIDTTKIEEKITKKTKAIVPVHMFGQPADMGVIMDIAKRHGLKVVEDCAQAFGADIKGKKAGSFGDTGCYSFYPSKNLGGIGDGGLITLNDMAVATEIRKLRNHGAVGPYLHGTVGFNSRLDEIQAVVLLIKLKRIDIYNELRRKKAALYTKLLKDKVQCPRELEGYYHVYHQYTIISPKRDLIQRTLKDNGISSTVYYPVPMHLQEPVKFLGYKEGDFKVAEKASKEVLSFPICPELEEAVIAQVAAIISGV